MKKHLLLVPAFLAVSSYSAAEIAINDFLSFEGFVDMSYSHTDNENSNDQTESGNSFAIDQVEISWLFDFDPVTAQIDLQYEDLPGSDTAVEQAFATYDFGNGVTITAGRYASMLGFEAFEPTGLYQFSLAYDIHSINDFNDFNSGLLDDIEGNPAEDNSDVSIIPGYAHGVKITYEADTWFFGLSVQDEVFGTDPGRLGGDDSSSFGVELAGSISFDNGLTWFLGGAYEAADETPGDSYVINTYVTYEVGSWIFAAELNYGESEAYAFPIGLVDTPYRDNNEKEEVFQALLMANYAYSEKASVTARVSYADHTYEDDVDEDLFDAFNLLIPYESEFDFVKYTLAYNYAFTDNLLLVNELSYVDGYAFDGLGSDAEADFDSLLLAVELIFSF